MFASVSERPAVEGDGNIIGERCPHPPVRDSQSHPRYLRGIFFVTQSPEVREPPQFFGIKPQPFRQVSGRLNGGNIPCRRRSRLHLLRLGQQLAHIKSVGVVQQSAANASVVAEKSLHISMSRTCRSSKLLQIAQRQRPQPPPMLSQPAGAAIDEKFNGRFAGEERLGQRPKKNKVLHDRRRRNASTSLTLREQFCAGRAATL